MTARYTQEKLLKSRSATIGASAWILHQQREFAKHPRCVRCQLGKNENGQNDVSQVARSAADCQRRFYSRRRTIGTRIRPSPSDPSGLNDLDIG